MSHNLKNALADLDSLNNPAPTRSTSAAPDALPAFGTSSTVAPPPGSARPSVFRRPLSTATASSPENASNASSSVARPMFPKPGTTKTLPPVPTSAARPPRSSLASGSGSTSVPAPLPSLSTRPPTVRAPVMRRSLGFSLPSTPAGASSSVKPAGGGSIFGRKNASVLDEAALEEDYAASEAAFMVIKKGPPPTPEQERVIECESQVIKVKAFAGAGKTSTLVGYANRRPRAKLLYIAFNRDIKLEAARKFSSNVKCMTSHGVAFGQFGVPLQDKFKIGLRWKFVYEATRIQSPSPSMARAYARLLMGTVANFVASAEPMVEALHLPHNDIQLLLKNDKIVKAGGLPDAQHMVSDAERLWSAMIDPRNTKIGVSHDAYLKLMQLAMPTLPYDGILLDEAQDSNPAVLSLVQRQACVQVLVGDPHQAIYGFRKAVDAMSKATADTTLELTGSFRFGPQIADFANAMLAMKGEVSSIRGLGPEGTVGTVVGRTGKGRSAFITRTNALLFHEAATRAQTNQKVYFAGGIEGAGFDLLRDLHHLYYNEVGAVKDPLLAAFGSYADFKTAVEENEEAEWTTRCKLVEEMGKSLLPRLQAIERNCVTDITLADQVFATAHKSKGLEFDHVVLGQDFYKAQASDGVPTSFVKDDTVEETNALYVASTRAKKSLVITDKHWKFWKAVSPMLDSTLPQARREALGANFDPAVTAHFERVAITRTYDQTVAEPLRSHAPSGDMPDGSRQQMASAQDFGSMLAGHSGAKPVASRHDDPFNDDPFDEPVRAKERKRL